MVHIRHVRVRVSHWPVFMRMCVWFADRVTSVVGVPVMDVMHVRVGVHEALVKMLVLVILREV